MESLLPDLLKLLIFAAAVYGGIRADIKAIHQSVADVKAAASRAHERIDELMLKEK